MYVLQLQLQHLLLKRLFVPSNRMAKAKLPLSFKENEEKSLVNIINYNTASFEFSRVNTSTQRTKEKMRSYYYFKHR
jgi:hypothetical protein